MRLARRRKRGGSHDSGIAVDWSRIADGRPRRLKRDVDFAGNVRDFGKAAAQAATAMEKRLLLTRDWVRPADYVWVQYADAEIEVGKGCPCGGTRLRQVGLSLVRCAACGATLLLAPSRDEEVALTDAVLDTPSTERQTLDDFSDVRLARFAENRSERSYVGFGLDSEGRGTLLVVRVPLVDGAEIRDEAAPLRAVHEVVFAKPESFLHGYATRSRLDEDAWEIPVI